MLFRLVYEDGSVEFVDAMDEKDVWENYVDDDCFSSQHPVRVEVVKN